MNDLLMKAVLSLDVYNRYDNRSMIVNFNTIGKYTLRPILLPDGSANISFVAAAYTAENGSTIVSYRGTDQWGFSADPLNGFPIALGVPFGPQFLAAIQFYQSVVSDLQDSAGDEESNVDPAAISLTGHSLGGGLAGLVAAFYNKQGTLFANMPFEQAVWNAYQYILGADLPLDTNPDAPYSNPVLHDLAGGARALIYGGSGTWAPLLGSNLHGYAVEDEFLGFFGIRPDSGTPVEPLDPGTSDDFSLDPTERHSMSLHTLLLWEQENHATVNGWQEIAPYLWNTYKSDTIGTAIGFGTIAGVDSAGEKMAAAVAYSVVDEGNRPFGDTAVRALFDDARDFGKGISDGSSGFMTSAVKQDLTNTLVHYAGLLANNAVLGESDGSAANGVFTLHDQSASLSVDFQDSKWTVNGTLHTPNERTELVTDVVSQIVPQASMLDALQWYERTGGGSYSGYELIGSVTFGLKNVDIPSLDVPSGQLDLIIPLQGVNALTRGNSDDMLLGGSGGESLWGGGGVDVIFGGGGDDELRGGEGDDYLDGGADTDIASYFTDPKPITISYYGSGANPSISVEDGTGGTDTLHSIERITGTAGRDIVNIVGQIASGTNLTIDANGGQGSSPRDSINLSRATAGATVTLNAGIGTISTGASQNINLVGFHTSLIGSGFADNIQDDSTGHKQIDAGDGDDTISIAGSVGEGLLLGGGGDDTITGGSSYDFLEGGSGNDTLIGGAGSDVLNGGDGYDELHGGAGSDLLIVDGQGYSEDYDGSVELLDGGDGDDKLVMTGASYSNIVLQGGAGNDIYDVRVDDGEFRPTIKINPGDGHDALVTPLGNYGSGFGFETEWGANLSMPIQVDFSEWSKEDAEIIWDAGIIGTATDEYGIVTYELSGNMVVKIKDSDESIIFHGISGRWSPREDFNNIAYDNYVSGTILLDTALPYVLFSDGYIISLDGVINIDMTIGSVAGYDVAQAGYESGLPPAPPSTGDSGDNYLSGTLGDDQLSGGDGDDSFSASNGDDTIDGGAGNDELEIFGARSAYSVTAGANGTTVVTGLNNPGDRTTLTSVESVFFVYDGRAYGLDELLPIAGSEGNDTLLNGTSGDNELFGLGGNDTILGGAGDDRIDGGADYDTARYLGSASDFAIGTNANGDIIALDRTGAEGMDILSNVEALQFDGDNRTILANDVTTNGEGTAGDDLFTLDVAWSIDGGDGNDILVVDGSSYEVATGGTIFGLVVGDVSVANVETIWFKGDGVFLDAAAVPTFGTAGSDTIVGTDRADFIENEGGDDVVLAGFGNDVIIQDGGTLDVTGGAGDDTIRGIEGNDIYRYDRGDGRDSIEDYGGDDRLVFGSSIAPDDVIVTADWDTGNIVVTFDGFSGAIDLNYAQSDPSYFIDEFWFADGTTWDADDIRTKAGMDDMFAQVSDDVPGSDIGWMTASRSAALLSQGMVVFGQKVAGEGLRKEVFTGFEGDCWLARHASQSGQADRFAVSV